MICLMGLALFFRPALHLLRRALLCAIVLHGEDDIPVSPSGTV
jgi:hypothetical protein